MKNHPGGNLNVKLPMIPSSASRNLTKMMINDDDDDDDDDDKEENEDNDHHDDDDGDDDESSELQNVNLFTRSKTFKPNFTRRKTPKLRPY